MKKGLHTMTEWELELIAPGNPKPSDGKTIKVDSHIYHKLGTPRYVSMTFDSMLQKAEKKKVLGSDSNLYPRLKHLRKLRNKVHLQTIDHPTDTDWNKFGPDDIRAMAQVLQLVFTGGIFRPSEEEKDYFSYLAKYF